MKPERDIAAERLGDLRPDHVLFLEFNELCPPLLRQWMDSGHLPNFKRLHDQSAVFVTDPDVTEQHHLEPWIQWYSLHTGLAYDQHGVFHLTDGLRREDDDLYRVLLRAGRDVGSFSSMNVRPFDGTGSFYVADPWTDEERSTPDELNAYSAFIAHNVREYTNEGAGLGVKDYARFLSFVLSHGLRVSTMARIAAQLVTEKVKDRRLHYRRAALLDRIQFDIFRHYFLKHRPALSTFFINSTAHLQHAYWRHMEPGRFADRPSDADVAVYGPAVQFGYRSMDRLVGAFIDLADRHGVMLVFMTALSQQPYLKYEGRGGQQFYRLTDLEGFLTRAGIRYASVDPVMTHQYVMRFDDPADLEAARQRLARYRMGETEVFGATVRDDELCFGCQLFDTIAPDAQVTDGGGPGFRFFDQLYHIDAVKSAFHHPDGALWFRTGRHVTPERRASILDVFPTTLELLGCPPPVGTDRRGRSLMPVLAGEQGAVT